MNGIDYNSLSTEELEALANQVDTAPDEQQLMDAGFIQPPPTEIPTEEGNNNNSNTQDDLPPVPKQNKLNEAADTLGVEHPQEGKQYKDSKWDVDTIKDAALSMGVEASHVLVPKNMELQYEPQTRAGEALKYGYRYMVGTAAMFLPTGWVGGLIKGASKLNAISKIPQAAKLLLGTGKFIKGEGIAMKSAAKFAKAKGIDPRKAMYGAKAINASVEGTAAGMAADYTLYRPEDNEGHIADIFGNTNNSLISYMQTKEDDTEAEAKLKNVVDGLAAGLVVGNAIEFSGIKPLLAKSIKGIKGLFNAKNEKEAMVALKETTANEIAVDKMSDSVTMIGKVQQIYDQCLMSGDDPSELIVQQFKAEDINEAKGMLQVLQDGDTFHFNQETGEYVVKVSKWQDAGKYGKDAYDISHTPEEKIAHMDAATKEAWTNRNWIDGSEKTDLITVNDKGVRKGNTKSANNIVKQYKDKFKLDNNIKVEFREGLVDAEGKAIQGTTQTTEYLGKNTKNQKNAIDKAQTKIEAQQLKVDKLQDKITFLEGTNDPVMEELEVAQRELKIAQDQLTNLKNDLKEIQKPSKLANHTILIDVNTENPYAVLRSELEHIKNLSDGSITKGEHRFPRYNNATTEDALASEYVAKKAGKKAADTDSYTFTQAEPDGFGENRVEISNSKGQNLGYVEYTIKDNTLSIDDVMNTSKGTNFATPNVAAKLIDNLLAQNPDIKHIKWNATTPQGMKFKENYLKIHSELDGKVSGISKYEELDKEGQEAYNENLRWLNDNQSKNQRGSRTEVRGDNQTSTGSKDATAIQSESKDVLEKPMASSNSRDLSRGKTSSNNLGETEQLKIDFNTKVDEAKTPENITQGIKSGEINISSAEDVGHIVDTVIKNDFDISGTKWKDIAEDVDKYFSDGLFSDTPSIINAIKELIVKDDIKSLDILTRKVLALQKFSSMILEEIANFPKNGSDDVLLSLHSAIDAIKAYTKGTGSGAGRLLEARKLINLGKETFGINKMSNMTVEGINTFSDMLEKIVKDTFNTNFTVTEKFQQIYGQIIKQFEPEFVQSLQENPDFAQEITKIIQKSIVNNDASNINKDLRLMFAKMFAKEQQELAERAATKKGIWNVLSKNVVTYYVTNLLSGVSTIIKNIGSGIANIAYNPALKVVAGSMMGGGEQLTKEGLYAWKGLGDSIFEAWALTKQAWLKGEGSLVSFKDEANMDTEYLSQYLKLTDFDDPNLTLGQKIWNYYSFMSRAMMASDEFLTQLNYRMTARGKAYAFAEADLNKGLIKNTDMTARAEDYLKSFYDADGRPINTDILYESKQATYQTPLDGSFTNPITGEEKQMRNQSLVMKSMDSLNKLVNSNPFAKLFLPFLRTGANILQMNLDHNLAYQTGSDFFNYLTKGQKSLLLDTQSKEGAMARARCAFGMGTLVLGGMMAAGGIITGSAPTDPKERKALFATGWRPYSININGNWVSYQGYEPIHTLLGFATDCYQAYTAYKNPEQEAPFKAWMTQMYPAIINNFIDKAAFRTGLNQIAILTDPESTKSEKLIKTLAQVPQGMLPESALIRNTGSMGHRDATSPRTFYEKVFNNYFNRGLGDYRRDIFGNRQDIYGMIITNKTDNTYNSPEYFEMARLGSLGFSPSELTDTISGTKLKIKDFKDPKTGKSAYDAMGEELSTLTINGKTLQEAISEKVQDPEYAMLPDGVGDDIDWNSAEWSAYNTKVKELRAIYLEYNNQAEQNVIGNCDNFVNNKGETMGEASERINVEGINKTLESDTSNIVDKLRSLH